MGLFKKNSDPISQRSRELNKQIARLESEIRKLSSQQPPLDPAPDDPPNKPPQPATAPTFETEPPPQKPSPESPTARPGPAPYPEPGSKPPLLKPDPASIPKIGSNTPRLRTTTTPDGVTKPAAKPEASPELSSTASEPIFEDLPENPFRPATSRDSKEQEEELGLKQDHLAASWKRMKNHLKGPPATNPKLVNYLAAGSIQGLRPLRYERRVARNRFIVLTIIFVLILWGILALLLRR